MRKKKILIETVQAKMGKIKPRQKSTAMAHTEYALSLALCLFWGLALSVADATTIDDAVQLAIRTNPQVLTAAATLRANGYDLKRARAGYFPSVDMDAGYGREHTNFKQLKIAGNDKGTLSRREVGLTVSQLLWDGYATKSEVERRVALINAAQHSLNDTQEAIAFRASEAFIDVIRNRELVALARDNVAAHEVTLGNVEAKHDSGVGNLADVEQARARVALASSTLIAREGRLRESIVRYERVIGETPIDLAMPIRSPSGLVNEGTIDRAKLDSVIDGALGQVSNNHPAILQTQEEVKAADSAIRAAKSRYHPRIDLEGRLRRDDAVAGVEGVRNSNALMVVARWNLFRGGADKAEQMAAFERKSAAQENAEDTRRFVAENVAVAYQARATTESRIVYLEQYVAASQGTLRSYRSQFELGRRTLLDVLNAENELFNARSNLASGLYDDLDNQYFVEASKGLLLDNFGISSSK